MLAYCEIGRGLSPALDIVIEMLAHQVVASASYPLSVLAQVDPNAVCKGTECFVREPAGEVKSTVQAVAVDAAPPAGLRRKVWYVRRTARIWRSAARTPGR